MKSPSSHEASSNEYGEEENRTNEFLKINSLIKINKQTKTRYSGRLLHTKHRFEVEFVEHILQKIEIDGIKTQSQSNA
jgi:hypothetical protein